MSILFPKLDAIRPKRNDNTISSARRRFFFFFLFVSLNIIFIVFNAYRLFTSATLAVGVFT